MSAWGSSAWSSSAWSSVEAGLTFGYGVEQWGLTPWGGTVIIVPAKFLSAVFVDEQVLDMQLDVIHFLSASFVDEQVLDMQLDIIHAVMMYSMDFQSLQISELEDAFTNPKGN
jgi:hypothetical protein